MNRRDFVATAAAAAAGVGMLCTAGINAALGQDATPPATPPAAAAPLAVGKKSDYTKDGPTMTWATDHHIIVAREDNKLYAMSSKCTHKGCDIADATNQFHCPCHNSDFQYDGTNIDGPAKKPLPRYAISAADDGTVSVDTSTQFKTPAEWADPKSFVKMDPAT
jgi:cytochrome b6-f complex iron-sulfur subunit